MVVVVCRFFGRSEEEQRTIPAGRVDAGLMMGLVSIW